MKGNSKEEIINLRNMLDSNDSQIRKKAANNVVSLMRSGENMGCLFSSMLRCVQTDDLQLKKLVYLYLVTYSSQEPEQSIMTVSTFIKDSEDPNPIVRALALRTMPRIKIETVAEHMIMPLKKSLKDKDPYVRKTAVLSVAKIYDVIPEVVENSQILDDLISCLNDENPMVVSNTTASLFEINERRASPIFKLDENNIAPILSALTQCSGWVQTILLDALAQYVPINETDAKFLIDRLLPFLKNANPAVVIGAFKCVYKFMNYDKRDPKELFSLMIPPFITLITSNTPEIQFVVLRTLSLFVMKYPKALSKELRVFFCKYNDPSYIKIEKLSILIKICNSNNVSLVLDELEDYSNFVDVKFVRKAIQAIGKVALKIEAAAKRAVDILIKLQQSEAEYTVEESIIVIADILRRYPGEFESIIQTLNGLEKIKDSKAKAAAIWIIGEYNEIIENSDVILDPYLDSFQDEAPEVQLQLLTAFVKIYVNHPEQSHDQLQFVLNSATKDSILPDVKNRALIYWRLLSTDIKLSKQAVSFSKQTEPEDLGINDPEMLSELIGNMGNISGVLHIIPSDFVRRIKYLPEDSEETNDEKLYNWKPINIDDQNIDLFYDWDYMTLILKIFNKSQNLLSDLAVAFNKNWAGIGLKDLPYFPSSLEFGDSCEIPIQLTCTPTQVSDSLNLQIAIKTNYGNKIFEIPIYPSTVIQPFIDITMQKLQEAWGLYKSDTKIQIDGNLASEQTFKERKFYLMSKENNSYTVAFTLPPSNIYIAKVQQINDKKVLVLLHGNEKFFSLISQDAENLFCE